MKICPFGVRPYDQRASIGGALGALTSAIDVERRVTSIKGYQSTLLTKFMCAPERYRHRRSVTLQLSPTAVVALWHVRARSRLQLRCADIPSLREPPAGRAEALPITGGLYAHGGRILHTTFSLQPYGGQPCSNAVTFVVAQEDA